MTSPIKPVSLQAIVTEVGIDQPSFMSDYGAVGGALVIKNGAISIFEPAQRMGRPLISDRGQLGRVGIDGSSVKDVFCVHSRQAMNTLRSSRSVVGYRFSRV